MYARPAGKVSTSVAPEVTPSGIVATTLYVTISPITTLTLVSSWRLVLMMVLTMDTGGTFTVNTALALVSLPAASET